MEKQVKRSLPVQLTEKERLNKSLELTTAMEEQSRVEFDAKIAKDNFKAKVDELGGVISQLQRVVHSGKENRMVDCEWKFNFLKMEKSLIRLDTGEVITVEPLTDTERQLAISVDAVPETDVVRE